MGQLQNSDLKVVGEEKDELLEDEFDITELAAKIGVYSSAPNQERETPTTEEINSALQKTLEKMDADGGIKAKNLDEVFDELNKGVSEQLEAEKNSKLQGKKVALPETDSTTEAWIKEIAGKIKVNSDQVGQEEEYKVNGVDDKYHSFMKTHPKGDIRRMNIPTNNPTNRALNVIKGLCLCLEEVAFATDPNDYSEAIPPNVLTVSDWNELISKDCDDEVRFDFRHGTIEFTSDNCRYNASIRNAFNKTQEVFAFYKKSANLFEEDGFWLEDVNDPKLLGFKALEMVKELRDLLPEPVDKTYGFEAENPASDKSLMAITQMIANMSNDTKDFISNAVNAFEEDFNRTHDEEHRNEKEFLVYLNRGYVQKFVKHEVELEVDENNITRVMIEWLITCLLTKRLFNKPFPLLAAEIGKEIYDQSQGQKK